MNIDYSSVEYKIIKYLGVEQEYKPMADCGVQTQFREEYWNPLVKNGYIEKNGILYRCTEKGKNELLQLLDVNKIQHKKFYLHLLKLWIGSGIITLFLYMTLSPGEFGVFVVFGAQIFLASHCWGICEYLKGGAAKFRLPNSSDLSY